MRPELALFNTASLNVEPVRPLGGLVTLYVCGITPYDTTHVGHAFTYVVFDVLRRVLLDAGYQVKYTQNVTDIDDDILRKASEVGLPYDELALRETKQYLDDMAALNVAMPDSYIKATDVIPEIVEAIGELLREGVAYQPGGNVYFDNRSFPNYGSLCHCERSEMLRLAAERGGFPDDPAKRDPLDFLLWQGEKAGEPSWPSQFGAGRPGWHIECSTIADITLGVPLTIHGGGSDLIFPHHASEIAQAESIHHGVPFVQHWVHTGMVRYQGEKMSKSLGNLVLVRDLLDRYSADAIRLYLLSHRYREEFEFEEEGLRRSASLAEKLSMAIGQAPSELDGDGPTTSELRARLQSDLDTPRAIERAASLLDDPAGPTPEEVSAIRWLLNTLGLTLSAPAALEAGHSA